MHPRSTMRAENLVEVSQRLIMSILACSFDFHAITLERSKNPSHYFSNLVALWSLISLMSCLVACSSRTIVDRQTNKQTDTRPKYRNPRCACAPRVKPKPKVQGMDPQLGYDHTFKFLWDIISFTACSALSL